MTSPAKTPAKRAYWAYLIAVLLIVALVAVYLVHRRQQQHSKLQVIGTIKLYDLNHSGNVVFEGGTDCAGHGQYQDIAGGTIVHIVDSAGHTSQSDRLSLGASPDNSTECIFYFGIQPEGGRSYYDLSVGDRAPVRFTQDQLHDLELTFGK